MSKTLWKFPIISLLAIGLLVAGCSKDKEGNTTRPVTSDGQSEKAAEKESYQAPFTGVTLEKAPTMRPVIVTINNHPKARPQSGIGKADIIYEMIAEANVTRLLAVYQSELPENIGPVRSARDYFIELSKGLDAFYVAHGYSPDAKKLLSSGAIDNINGMQYDGSLFIRSTDRVAPHNSYISADHVKEGAEKVKVSLKMTKKYPFTFYESVEDAKMGEPANKIDIRYGSNEQFHNQYLYVPETKQYKRLAGGVVTTDLLTKKEVQLSNVLFFEIPHKTIDSEGRQQLNLASGGKAYIFQAGVMKQIEWKNEMGVLVPMENGKPAPLVPGQTWIHFVPTDPGLTSLVTYTP